MTGDHRQHYFSGEKEGKSRQFGIEIYTFRKNLSTEKVKVGHP